MSSRRVVCCRISGTLCVLLLLAGVHIAANTAAGRDAHLTIAAGGVPVSGDVPSRFQYLAGSSAQFVIVVRLPNGQAKPIEYHGKRAEWPHGLMIHVSDESGTSHPEWLSEMQIRPYLPWGEALADSLWRANIQEVPDYYKHEHYDFLCIIPAAAAGHTIILSATFEHPENGLLRTKSPVGMYIIAPQTEEDRDRIWDTHICYANHAGEYERSMALADSFIAQGYTGMRGLADARTAAVLSKHFDAALRYMDLNMAVNGCFRIEKSTHDLRRPSEGPPPSPEEVRRQRAAANEAEYQRLRNEYLQKITEQQQQQR